MPASNTLGAVGDGQPTPASMNTDQEDQMTDKPAKPVRRRIRATKPKTKTVSASASAQCEPSHDQIAERAYFLALAQGGGDELGNWLRAEAELAAA